MLALASHVSEDVLCLWFPTPKFWDYRHGATTPGAGSGFIPWEGRENSQNFLLLFTVPRHLFNVVQTLNLQFHK